MINAITSPHARRTLQCIVTPNPAHRTPLKKIAETFRHNHPGEYLQDVDEPSLRELLADIGIAPVAGTSDEFAAEYLPKPFDMQAFSAERERRMKHACTPPPSNVFQLPGARRTETAATVVPDPALPERVSAADRALRIGGKDVTRIKTGFPTLDKATRGGILLAKVVVIGGAPGAGKTATALAVAYRCLMAGIAVGILAADEDADALLIRLGQQHGLSRDLLESGDVAEREKLAAWCRSVPLILVDGDEAGATVEQVSTELRALAGEGPTLLVVDSMQTARSVIPLPKGADLRTRVNETVRALKRAAKLDRHVVVATSELAKAAYRNKSQAENINALSAFKESGDIEYGTSLALVLTSRSGTSDFVDAAVVKNRLGSTKPEFLLRLIHDRADVTETNSAAASELDPLHMVKTEIIDAVEDAKGMPVTKNFLAERVGGNRSNALKAINQLLDAHKLHQTKQGIRFPLPGDPGYEEEA